MANKALVLTLPARRSFGIIARHKGLGGGFGFVLPVKARAGRTMQALYSILRQLIRNVGLHASIL